jgi:uncharacterized protein DUF222
METNERTDPAVLSLDELETELATLASHLYAGTCRWLELVAEIDRRGSWADEGQGSCAAWLAWRCALTPRAAREHVRVARRLPELLLTRAAFAHGELSYAKVRALTRVATAENEEELLHLARALTAAQLERAVRAYRRVTTEESRDLQESAYLDVSWEPDGSLAIHGRLAPEDGALLMRALDALRDADWERRRGSAEPRPPKQASRAEALVAVADAALAHTGEGRPAGERYQVVVHVDESALSHEGAGGCELEDGSALSSETARRIACDASVVRNGRKTRAIPPAMRRGLRARDRGCRFPAARTGASSTPTMSTTGLEAARPGWTTCSCSAAGITGSSTKAATASTGKAGSTTRGDPACPRFRACRAAARLPCWLVPVRSRSTATPVRRRSRRRSICLSIASSAVSARLSCCHSSSTIRSCSSSGGRGIRIASMSGM